MFYEESLNSPIKEPSASPYAILILAPTKATGDIYREGGQHAVEVQQHSLDARPISFSEAHLEAHPLALMKTLQRHVTLQGTHSSRS